MLHRMKLLYPHSNSMKYLFLSFLILQMRKLQPREVKWFSQSHTAEDSRSRIWAQASWLQSWGHFSINSHQLLVGISQGYWFPLDLPCPLILLPEWVQYREWQVLEAGSHGHKWAGNGYNYWQNSLGCFIAEESFMLHLGVERWREFRMEVKRCGSCVFRIWSGESFGVGQWIIW